MKLAVRDRIEPDDDDDDDDDDDSVNGVDQHEDDHYDVESGARDEAGPASAPKTDS